jgi:hypothetical protein
MDKALDHPAVDVAVEALTSGVLALGDRDLRPVTAVVRDGMVAVLLYSERGLWVSFVRREDGQWVAPGMITGSPRPDGPRASHTPEYMPLQRKSTKRFALPRPDGTPQSEGWLAVTGLAALDAVSVSVTSELEESIMPIGEDGLAFTVVRARWTEEPDVYVHTSDGRRVSATLRQAG